MVKPTNEKPDQGSDSAYKGVRKRKWGKWVSEIRFPNSRKRIWLGSYDTPEKAARAFDAALFCLRGKNAKFNFPENKPDISGGGSLKPHEIQAVAARFANENPPENSLNREQIQSEHSPSSVSNGAVAGESDTIMDWSFLDSLPSDISGDSVSEFGGFSGLDVDYFSGDFFPSLPTVVDYEEENNVGVYPTQQSFLWNF